MEKPQKTIVVADDDDDLRLLVRVTLEDASTRVITVEDGCRALEVVRTRLPDLLIIDWMMPGMTGDEVVRRLREDSEASELPIVMLTAKDGGEFERQMVPFHLAGLLKKPFSPLALIKIVREALFS